MEHAPFRPGISSWEGSEISQKKKKKFQIHIHIVLINYQPKQILKNHCFLINYQLFENVFEIWLFFNIFDLHGSWAQFFNICVNIWAIISPCCYFSIRNGKQQK